MNEIILSSDFELTKRHLVDEYGINNLRFFEKSEILLEDATKAKQEAYIAEVSEKIVVLIGYKFRVEAQNSLLLILENTPKNIKFILVSDSKNSFLPTIRSRMIIKNSLEKVVLPKISLNLRNLSLKELSIFIDEKVNLEKKGEFDKIALKNTFQAIIKESFISGVKFSEQELEYINKLMILINLNTKSRAILTPLLLIISEKQGKI